MTAAHLDPDDRPGAEVVPLRPRDVVDADLVEGPCEQPDPATGDPVAALHTADRAWLAAHGWRPAVTTWTDTHHLPSPRQAAASAKWWTVHGGHALALLTARAPLIVLAELRPIARGTGKVAGGWARWVQCTSLAEAARSAEGNERSKAGERLEVRKSGRVRLSVAALLLLAGVGIWLALAHPELAAVAAVLLVGVLDLVGRSGRAAEPVAPLLPVGPIADGVPLSSLRAEIESSLAVQGFDPDTFTIAQPQVLDAKGWTIPYQSRHPLDDEHLRQVERDLQVRRGAITAAVERGNAARGQLHLMLVDPLADIVEAPDPGPLSIHQRLPLGVCASGQVWVESFLRVQFSCVGSSQSGKSSLLWQIVDVLRRCPEVELDGIDLTDGPAFSACRRAFRRRGTDEDGARRILGDAVALIKVRAGELSRLAEADDTPDDYDEKWQPTPDHPQRVILIDEFALVAQNDELLPMVEHIQRYGAKCAVVCGKAGQGTTLGDFGTSAVRGQDMLKVLFACSRSDVLTMFGKDARDGGYRPDLLEPANGADVRDAGKCWAMSASSRSAEPRRAYRLDQAEVRRRDRALGKRRHGAVDAVEVPPVLAAAERVAAGTDFAATADVLAELGDGWTGKRLAMEMAKHRVSPVQRGTDKVRGYRAADVARAIRDL